MISLRSASVAVVALATMALSACSGGGHEAASDASSRGSASVHETSQASCVTSAPTASSLKSGAVCALVPAEAVGKKIGQPILKHDDKTMDMDTGNVVHDPEGCSYYYQDDLAHIVVVQRIANIDDAAWAQKKSDVESGKLEGAKKATSVGDNALNLGDAFYLVRVNDVVIQVQDLRQRTDVVNDEFVAFVVGQLT